MTKYDTTLTRFNMRLTATVRHALNCRTASKSDWCLNTPKRCATPPTHSLPPPKTRRLTMIKTCEHCGKTFNAKRRDTRFCSPKCNDAAYYITRKIQQLKRLPAKEAHHAK